VEEHWAEVIFPPETLAMKVRGQDGDSFDLSFAFGGSGFQSKNSIEWIKKVMENPKSMPRAGVRTDTAMALSEFFERSMREIEKPSTTNVKLVILITLTDGLWEGMADRQKIKDKIVA
jgi:hypothetical protein